MLTYLVLTSPKKSIEARQVKFSVYNNANTGYRKFREGKGFQDN